MRRTWIVLAALATTIAGGVPLAQAQDSTTQQAQDNTTQNGTSNGITMGGHIGFVLPLGTHVGGRTINETADQFSIGCPGGVTFKGSGRTAFVLDLATFIHT